MFSREQLAQTLALIVLAIVGGGMVIVGAAYAWVSKDLASIEDVEKRILEQSTLIYARDGKTILYDLGDNKREDVPLDQIDEKIQWATIALEDQQFYSHSGFKIKSFARAAIRGIIPGGEYAGGSSTLTQQFVKNAILTSERTYTRKLKELILAVRLERKYEKDEILKMYLNEVYYGANLQGVEVAAKEYFEKSASDVTLAEAATIAALPKDPVKLPRDPERLKGRRDHALNQMVELDYITEEEAEQAKQEPVELFETVTEINAPHLVFYVRGYLEEKYGQANIRKGGYSVVTTIDWEKQQKAEQAVKDGMAKVEQYGGSNAALVSIDTHTGQVLAMVGSRDFFDEEHDGQVNVATSPRQPGSSFKPVVYLTAFMKGYTPDTKLYDIETDFLTEVEGKYHPRNYDLKERGPVTLRYALAQSLNIPAVKLLYLVGVGSALDTAESLGYTSLRDRSRFGLSLVLGGAEVSLLEHTSAYATFAREGEWHKPVTVLEVRDKDGEVLEQWEDNPVQAVPKNAIRILNSVLSDAAMRGSVFSRLNLSDRPSAAKTGTTNDYRDAWALGYTPSIATGVWTGNNDNAEMTRGADGVVIAAPIWRSYMESVLAGTPVETFKQPRYTPATEVLGGNLDSLVTKTVDTVTGELIPAECLETYPEEYKAEKEFKETHTILHYVDRADPTGAPPEDPREDPMYEAWETAVVRWTKEETQQGQYFTEETPEVDCALRDPSQQPEVTITSLEVEKEYTQDSFVITAKINPGKNRDIVKVEYLVDVIAVDSSAPETRITQLSFVTSDYKPKTLTEGKHTITVRVTDDNGNTAEASVKILYIKE